jgi:DNA-binding response OmpR family regulator
MRQTILIVDDDPQIRAMCTTTLEESGYSVREASNGKKALAEIKKAACDLIVLDLSMPDVDGFEFLKAVRVEEPTLKVIAIADSDDVDQSFRSHADQIGAKRRRALSV